MPNAAPPPLRSLRFPAALFTLVAFLSAGTLIAGLLSGCQRTAAVRDGDDPKTLAQKIEGGWTLTLNPEDVEAEGIQPRNIALTLVPSRLDPDGTGGALRGLVGKRDFDTGRFSVGDEDTAPTVQFTSDDVAVPSESAEGSRVVRGPLTWSGEFVGEDTIRGTVSGPGVDGATGPSNRWVATRNSAGVILETISPQTDVP